MNSFMGNLPKQRLFVAYLEKMLLGLLLTGIYMQMKNRMLEMFWDIILKVLKLWKTDCIFNNC